MISIICLITSSFAFAIGHDTPVRYEWESQLEKVEKLERNPSSYAKWSEQHPFQQPENGENFKIEYSDKEK